MKKKNTDIRRIFERGFIMKRSYGASYNRTKSFIYKNKKLKLFCAYSDDGFHINYIHTNISTFGAAFSEVYFFIFITLSLGDWCHYYLLFA